MTKTITRTCDQLGICQGRSIPCLNCTRIAPKTEWTPDEVTCTPIEQIGYWITVLILAALSTAAVAGFIGYLHVRQFDQPTTVTTTMPEPIVSIAKIEAEARQAAAIYTDINAACPYPFGTDAARVFKLAFNDERAMLQQAPALANTAQAAMKGVAP